MCNSYEHAQNLLTSAATVLECGFVLWFCYRFFQDCFHQSGLLHSNRKQNSLDLLVETANCNFPACSLEDKPATDVETPNQTTPIEQPLQNRQSLVETIAIEPTVFPQQSAQIEAIQSGLTPELSPAQIAILQGVQKISNTYTITAVEDETWINELFVETPQNDESSPISPANTTELEFPLSMSRQSRPTFSEGSSVNTTQPKKKPLPEKQGFGPQKHKGKDSNQTPAKSRTDRLRELCQTHGIRWTHANSNGNHLTVEQMIDQLIKRNIDIGELAIKPLRGRATHRRKQVA
ncbi:hypothetical protein ACQ4M3_29160 [Leptolyngbya sp. AN03gr2]|uniref:hypothetical protein n=1 Tax=unclassified Leptolyngbya TaxID=2650499 RepID=UPI003D30FD02